MGYKPPILSYEEIAELAEEFVAEFHPEESLPVPVEEIVEWDFEMAIIPVLGLKDRLRVDAFLASDLTAIFVDDYVLQFVPNRYRFSLAHELAHYYLHDELYQSVEVRNISDWSEVQRQIGEDDYSWFEYQANAFAGLVLVPPARLKARFTRRVGEAQEEGLDRSAIVRFPLRQRLIEGLASEFVVSEQTMTIRLEKDGLLPPLIER